MGKVIWLLGASWVGWVLAQDPSGVLAGHAGWVGAGILGAVLAWLFFIHLPSKDKQLKELLEVADKRMASLIKDKDTQLDAALLHKWQAMQTMSNDHRDMVKALASEFRASLETLAAHCDHTEERLLRLVEAREKQLRQAQGLSPP